MNRPAWIVVHHTGGTNTDPLADTSNHTPAIVNEHHKTLWPGFVSTLGWHVGYHYFITKDGTLTQTRRDWEEGAHTRGMNRKSIGVCLAGNFDATIPTREQEKTLRALLSRLTKQHNVPRWNIVPHRRFSTKTCYGRRLTDTWAADLLQAQDERTPLSEYTWQELIAELRQRIAEKGT